MNDQIGGQDVRKIFTVVLDLKTSAACEVQQASLDIDSSSYFESQSVVSVKAVNEGPSAGFPCRGFKYGLRITRTRIT